MSADLGTLQISPETVDCAMQELQAIVNEMTGKSVPITRDTQMSRYFNEVTGADSLEYLDMSFRIEARLGVNLSRADWEYISGEHLCKTPEEWKVRFESLFTFGRVAELIAQRAELGKIESVEILGATSLAAGAFRRMEIIAGQIDNGIKPFGPSTEILDRLNGRKLRLFWARIRTLSGNTVPTLPPTFGMRASDKLLGKEGVAIALVAFPILFWYYRIHVMGLTSKDEWKAWLLAALLGVPAILGPIAVFLFVVSMLLRVLDGRIQPSTTILPHGIKTFRDVALLLAGERGGWCEKCGYDLTGLTSSRCPECGENREVTVVSRPQ